MSRLLLVGERVVLRPAVLEDRRRIYEWFACSDVSSLMIGPPTYPEQTVPSWEKFRDEHEPHYFDGSAPELGRCFLIMAGGEAVGQVSYNDVSECEGRKRTELDIWLRSASDCGRGYGPDALSALCRYLFEQFGVQEFLVQPSARNPNAIRAYEKIGFRPLGIPAEVAAQSWGPNDYFDSVYMVKRYPAQVEPAE